MNLISVVVYAVYIHFLVQDGDEVLFFRYFVLLFLISIIIVRRQVGKRRCDTWFPDVSCLMCPFFFVSFSSDAFCRLSIFLHL